MRRAAFGWRERARRLVALAWLGAASFALPACGLLVGIEDIGVANADGDASGGGGGGDAGPPPQGLGCDDAIPLLFDTWGTNEFDATTEGIGEIKSGPFNDCVGSDGPERVYVFDAKRNGVLTASLPATATSFDSVLYARKTSCANPDGIVLCHDQIKSPTGGEIISFPVTEGERIYLFVDGRTPADHGSYHLTVSFSEGDDCASPVPIVLGTDVGSTATLLGANKSGIDNDAKCGKCPMNPCAGGGRQTIYEIKAPLGKGVEVKLAASFDSVVYARFDCANGATQLEQNGCVDANDKGDETINLPGGVMPTYLFVDTSMNSPAGPFTLSLTVK
ncbi:hypothetical protein [Polyangium aurulentum]|uniref:hypothetical protein n=1 Tax=Polyangium aurulentum TaxID=2567896 RepID=UPI0010AE5815|nr:hypothetical protein [Polyangium aurulentum]UQA55236.1 hypothetical protein E8A73_028275 [Polyangium aurulentum]